MFERSRPSRSRCTMGVQLHTVGLDDEGRSPAPSAGPALDRSRRWTPGSRRGGSVPAAASWTSPPMTSKTRSTPAVSSGASVCEVDELLGSEVERRVTVGGPSGADDLGAGVASELRHHRADRRRPHRGRGGGCPSPQSAVVDDPPTRSAPRRQGSRPPRSRHRRATAGSCGPRRPRTRRGLPSRCQSDRPNTR